MSNTQSPNEWAWNEWEKLPEIENFTRHGTAFEPSGDNRRDAALSILLDISIPLGGAVAIRHPKFRWALDDDRGSRQMQTPTWGRIVVFQPRDRETGYPFIALDFECATIWNCNTMARRRHFRAGVSNNGIQGMALDAIAGRYDIPADWSMAGGANLGF